MRYVEFPILIEFANGPAAIMFYTAQGRSDTLPEGAAWIGRGPWWYREPSRPNIQRRIDATYQARNDAGGLVHPEQPIGWRMLADVGAIPVERAYRNAWRYNAGRIEHDMAKARELHRDAIRETRARKLAELDGLWMRATGQGKKAEADAVELERQKWRDAPADPRIDAAQTVEDLKAITFE